MQVLLEPLTAYESNVIITVNNLVAALDEVGSPRAPACATLCPFCDREPIRGYFEKLGPRIRHVSLVDSDGQSDAHDAGQRQDTASPTHTRYRCRRLYRLLHNKLDLGNNGRTLTGLRPRY